ncbi:uncharacterized protein LOC131677262 [Topomyia yanbarensis]|uniref:uncharacterized protein LOC131677262 n=1 Tax=Topomyia yanbarensis TaxID=2498891 RepID=UPI00273B7546|nr:uncharacterized protein LOC131677262 [Topomyia yanbarensis]
MCPNKLRVFKTVVIIAIVCTIITAPGVIARNNDFFFPELNEKAVGDLCEINYGQGDFTRFGTCQRVKDCRTFAQRVRYERRFNVFQELCFFEVHDPVVCCLSERDAAMRIRNPTVGHKSVLDMEWPFDDDDDKANLV